MLADAVVTGDIFVSKGDRSKCLLITVKCTSGEIYRISLKFIGILDQAALFQSNSRKKVDILLWK